MKVFGSITLLVLSVTAAAIAQQADVSKLLQESATLIQAGKFASAEPILRTAAKTAPANPDARNLLGIVLDQLGKTAEAEREYRESIRLNPRAVSPRANLGILLAKNKRQTEAVQTFESVLKIDPNHPQTIINLGLLYVAVKKYDLAVGVLKRAVEIQPNSFDLKLDLGIALYQTDHPDDAEAAFFSASVLSPTNAEPFYYLGMITIVRKQDEIAQTYFAKAVELDPKHAAANFQQGEIHAKYQHYVEARSFYEKALLLDASKPVYRIRLGGMYIFLGDFNGAFEIFQKAVKAFPDISEIHYFLAISARGKGDFALALSEAKRSLALKETADANALAGAILSDKNETAEAERYLRKAISLNPNHFNSNHDLGRLLVRQKNFAAAIPFLQRASTLMPEQPDPHYELFLAYSRLKQKADADRELAIFKQLSEKK